MIEESKVATHNTRAKGYGKHEAFDMPSTPLKIMGNHLNNRAIQHLLARCGGGDGAFDFDECHF